MNVQLTFQNSCGIGPGGELYKCRCDIGMNEKIIGNVKKGITNVDLFTKYMSDADPLYDSECIECAYFPICNGGCVFKRLQNTEKNAKLDVCIIQKEKLKKFMNLYYLKNEI